MSDNIAKDSSETEGESEYNQDLPSHYWQAFGMERCPFEFAPEENFYLVSQCEEQLELLWHLIEYNHVIVTVTSDDPVKKVIFLDKLKSNSDFSTHSIDASEDLESEQLLTRFYDAFHFSGELEEFIQKLPEKSHQVFIIKDAHLLPTSALQLCQEILAKQSPESQRLSLILLGNSKLESSVNQHFNKAELEIFHFLSLPALSSDETREYIEYCLQAAGLVGDIPLTKKEITQIHKAAGGDVNKINELTKHVLTNKLNQSHATSLWKKHHLAIVTGFMVVIACSLYAYNIMQDDNAANTSALQNQLSEVSSNKPAATKSRLPLPAKSEDKLATKIVQQQKAQPVSKKQSDLQAQLAKAAKQAVTLKSARKKEDVKSPSKQVAKPVKMKKTTHSTQPSKPTVKIEQSSQPAEHTHLPNSLAVAFSEKLVTATKVPHKHPQPSPLFTTKTDNQVKLVKSAQPAKKIKPVKNVKAAMSLENKRQRAREIAALVDDSLNSSRKSRVIIIKPHKKPSKKTAVVAKADVKKVVKNTNVTSRASATAPATSGTSSSQSPKVKRPSKVEQTKQSRITALISPEKTTSKVEVIKPTVAKPKPSIAPSPKKRQPVQTKVTKKSVEQPQFQVLPDVKPQPQPQPQPQQKTVTRESTASQPASAKAQAKQVFDKLQAKASDTTDIIDIETLDESIDPDNLSSYQNRREIDLLAKKQNISTTHTLSKLQSATVRHEKLARASTPPPAARSSQTQAASPHYTIQVLGSRDISAIKAFKMQHPWAKQARYYKTKLRGKDWYILTYGSYSTAKEAHQAIARMPASVRQMKPWVRKR